MRPKGINFLIGLSAVYIYLGLNYLLFGWFPKLFTVIVFVQLGFILVSLSPIGEGIIRFIYNARPILTNKDKEYLNPIFNSVYEDVIKTKWWTSKRIKLYIDRSMSINAYALGANTIAVTRGAIETLTEEQLKGVIAHEFGHLYRGDTMLPLIFIGGNPYFVFTFFIIKIMKIILNTSYELLGGNSKKIYKGFGRFILWLFCLAITPLVLLVQGLMGVNSRDNEYKADEFAFNAGYGENLISALYMFDKMDFGSGQVSIMERLKMSHPFTDDRICGLEGMGE
jgi:heat shock protein HtpX